MKRPCLEAISYLGVMVVIGQMVAGCGISSEMAADRAGPESGDWGTDGGNGEGEGEGDDQETDTTVLPPENEVSAEYLVPRGSGRFVFISDTASDSVIVVDSETLAIQVVPVGGQPTQVVPLGDENAAAVICLRADVVTVLRAAPGQPVSTSSFPIRPDTNSIAVSPDGKRLLVWFDSRFSEISGAPATDQEISLINLLAPASQAVRHTTVGIHPFSVRFTRDGETAFVLTEDGINVIDVAQVDGDRPRIVAPLEAGSFDPNLTDIAIAPDGTLALVRTQDMSALVTVSLEPRNGDVRIYELPEAPTDLDIASSGAFATIVLRSTHQLGICPLPLPEDTQEQPCRFVDIGDRMVGLASIAADDDSILLYTTVGSDPMDRRRLTLVSDPDGEPSVTSVLLERPIESVTQGVDGRNAVIIHDKIVPTDASSMPYAYSLVALADMAAKFQQLSVEPGPLLLTPDGDKGYLLLPRLRQVEMMDMGTFIVDILSLGSTPTSIGYAAGSDKVFVAQDHEAGRMTFVGVHDGVVKTVTGYALNDDIEY